MSRHIRGHYRISDTGEVLPIGDVNGTLKEHAVSTPASFMAALEVRYRIKRICVLGVTGAVIGVGLMASLPSMLQSFTERQNLQTAEFRQTLKHGGLIRIGGQDHHVVPNPGRDAVANPRPILED